MHHKQRIQFFITVKKRFYSNIQKNRKLSYRKTEKYKLKSRVWLGLIFGGLKDADKEKFFLGKTVHILGEYG